MGAARLVLDANRLSDPTTVPQNVLRAVSLSTEHECQLGLRNKISICSGERPSLCSTSR